MATPYQHFTMAWPSTFVQTAGILLIGVATGELAVCARHVKKARADDAACLAMIGDTRELAATHAPEDVIAQVKSQLKTLLLLRAARFEHGQARRPSLKMDEHGELRWGDARWEIDVHGWPNQEFALPVRAEGGTIGHFMPDPVAGSTAASAARQVAVVLADQVGAVMAGRDPQLP